MVLQPLRRRRHRGAHRHKAKASDSRAAGPRLRARREREGVEFDALLCAVGRMPNTAGYGLETLGIPVTQARTVETNEYLQTLYPNIYRLRRRRRPYQFTHTASHQAWFAAVNALFGGLRSSRPTTR